MYKKASTACFAVCQVALAFVNLTHFNNKNKKHPLKSGQKNNYSVCCGGDGEDRTLDLPNAIQALSRCTQKRTPV